MKKMRWLATLFAVSLLAACGPSGTTGSSEATPAETGSAPGDGHHYTTAVNAKTFKAEVEDADGVVLIDFWATWCGPCRFVAPVMEELGKEYQGKLKVVKVDVDKNQELATRFKVEAIPYFVLFKDGKMVDARVGADTKDVYVNWIGKYL